MGALKYAEFIDRLLNSCEYLDPRPAVQSKVIIPEDNQNAFKWKEQFAFVGDRVLEVADTALFDSDGNALERAFSYDFRTRGDIDPIFRVCNHGRLKPVNEPCHVHVGTRQLDCFSDSVGKDFAYAIHCIKNFYIGKKQDWEENDD